MIEKVNTMDETTKGKNVSELFESEEIYGPMGREPAEGITGGIKNLEEFLKKKKFADGGIINLTNNPMTASSKAGVETLRKGR